MDIQLISEKENPLLKRREVLASIDYQGSATTSKAELQKLLADQFKVNIDSIEISKILSENGLSKGKAWIKIWHDKKVQIYSEIKKEEKAEEKESTEEKTKQVEEKEGTEEKTEEG